MVAGEPSGDVLAAGLIREIKQHHPDATFYGIGGEHMCAEGFDALFGMDSIALMGIESVLKDLRNIIKIRNTLTQKIISDQPDGFIGVDVPDFNISMEKRLREAGIKVVHYVSPSVWAWRGYRIHKIKRAVNHVLTLFPFEKVFYDKHAIPATFIGHPTADKAVKIKQKTDISQRERTIALLPGSRRAEVSALLPEMLGAAALLHQTDSTLRFVLPFASEVLLKQHQASVVATGLPIDMTLHQSGEAMCAAKLSIVASGTAALEAMIYGSVMVVVYKVGFLSEMMFRAFRHVEHFSLPNHLLAKPEIPELSQKDVTAENIFKAAQAFLQDEARMQRLALEFEQVSTQLHQNTDAQAAKVVLDVLAVSGAQNA